MNDDLRFALQNSHLAVLALVALVCLFRITRGAWPILTILGVLLVIGCEAPYVFAQFLLMHGDDPQRAYDLYTKLNEDGPTYGLAIGRLLGYLLIGLSLLIGRRRKESDVPSAGYQPGGAAYQAGQPYPPR